MPTKVTYHPPRDFEVAGIELGEGGIVHMSPVSQGRNVYTGVGHIVVTMPDGQVRTAKIEVNPDNGEMRIMRLTRPGEKEVAKRRARPGGDGGDA